MVTDETSNACDSPQSLRVLYVDEARISFSPLKWCADVLSSNASTIVCPKPNTNPKPKTDRKPCSYTKHPYTQAVDGFVLHTAMKDVRKRAESENISAMAWISKFKDPFTVAVVFEDSAAVVGVLLATGGIGLTHLTGNPIWDGISSICIAALLAGVSLRLIQLNRSFILGKPVDQEITDGIRKILMRRRSVDAVYAAQTQWVGPSAFAYNAEVDFDGCVMAEYYYFLTLLLLLLFSHSKQSMQNKNKTPQKKQEQKRLLVCSPS